MNDNFFERVPTSINGYKIKKRLFQNESACSFVVKSSHDSKTYIMKILNAEFASTLELKMFFNYIRFGVSLRHKNIIHVEDCFSLEGENNLYCYVEEYATYGSLKKFIAHNLQTEQSISEINSWSIILQLVRAYRFLHANGILHCNVNPSNIMIFKNGSVKIRNFGMAKMEQGDAIEGESRGSILYKTYYYLYSYLLDQKKRKNWNIQIHQNVGYQEH